MCTERFFDSPCMNFKCPNNLFSKDLKLNRSRIKMTDRAVEIRNCCRLIMNPWTSNEISNAWGLPKEQIRRSEEKALKKLRREVRIHRMRLQATTTINRKTVAPFH